MQLFLFLLLVLLLHDRWVKSNAKYQGKKNINNKKLNIRLAYLNPMLEFESWSNESKSMIHCKYNYISDQTGVYSFALATWRTDTALAKRSPPCFIIPIIKLQKAYMGMQLNNQNVLFFFFQRKWVHYVPLEMTSGDFLLSTSMDISSAQQMNKWTSCTIVPLQALFDLCLSNQLLKLQMVATPVIFKQNLGLRL